MTPDPLPPDPALMRRTIEAVYERTMQLPPPAILAARRANAAALARQRKTGEPWVPGSTSLYD